MCFPTCHLLKFFLHTNWKYYFRLRIDVKFKPYAISRCIRENRFNDIGYIQRNSFGSSCSIEAWIIINRCGKKIEFYGVCLCEMWEQGFKIKLNNEPEYNLHVTLSGINVMWSYLSWLKWWIFCVYLSHHTIVHIHNLPAPYYVHASERFYL